jgi:FAD synthase
MKKRFKLKVIKGRGRGRKLGMKTLNFKIPKDFDLKRGVWQCFVFGGGRKYEGLLHYGPRPTFGEKDASLEVLVEDDLGRVEKLEVEVIRWVRKIKRFKSQEELVKLIKKDFGKEE